MNEGQFSALKVLLGELIKRHDRLIELLESQQVYSVEPIEGNEKGKESEANEKDKPAKPAKAPEPAPEAIVQVDERTAAQMEREGAFAPASQPTQAPAPASDAQKGSKINDKGYSSPSTPKRQQ